MQVTVSDGHPAALIIGTVIHDIVRTQDTWIVEDEWWRQPISRQYFSVQLENGELHTIFHDRVSDRWYAQDY